MATKKDVRIFTAIKLAAPNDRNGNPQRCWVVMNTTPSEMALTMLSGNIVTAIDCGYDDSFSQVEKFVEPLCKWHTIYLIEGPCFDVSVKEYKETLKNNHKLEHAAKPRDVQQSMKGGE